MAVEEVVVVGGTAGVLGFCEVGSGPHVRWDTGRSRLLEGSRVMC